MLAQIKGQWDAGLAPSFDDLSDYVLQTHQCAQTAAVRAVNQLATMRNWLIGCYIVEYEQKGKDRARYGDKLLKRLEERVHCRGLNETLFKVSRLFYWAYPQMRELFEGRKGAMPSHQFVTPPQTLVSRLSFSHIREILTEKDPLARFFYETECIRGCWSVSEHDLETSLLNHLEEFLLELGKGFCFEARQKRLVIDDEYYFADLVFYHRILHCSVICELKNDEFKHEYLGQLNAYVSYYKENEMHEGDNPPVGILLCTRKGEKMVEYAIAGMSNQLFVSTYQLQLPDKELLKNFLLRQLAEERENV